MEKHWTKHWFPAVLLLALGMAEMLESRCAFAQAQQPPAESKSWGDSITSGVKKGFDKVGNAINPTPPAKPQPMDEAISLKNKGNPGPELYVAMAQLFEQSGKNGEAEEQYQLALKLSPDHAQALSGYAQLKERLQQPDEAIRLYGRAIKAHPNSAALYNNLGLCFARLSRRDDAVATLGRAVALEPKNVLYRNNLAMILIEQNRPREAYGQLIAVHDEAAAYYNLGYLLHKKGQTQAAIRHFSLAMKADPSMAAAKRWIDYLERTTAQARLPGHPTANGVKIVGEKPRYEGDRPQQQNDQPPPRATPQPRRLPPIPQGNDEAADGPALPGISYGHSPVPAAPMPPPSANSEVRPLPRVN